MDLLNYLIKHSKSGWERKVKSVLTAVTSNKCFLHVMISWTSIIQEEFLMISQYKTVNIYCLYSMSLIIQLFKDFRYFLNVSLQVMSENVNWSESRVDLNHSETKLFSCLSRFIIHFKLCFGAFLCYISQLLSFECIVFSMTNGFSDSRAAKIHDSWWFLLHVLL